MFFLLLVLLLLLPQSLYDSTGFSEANTLVYVRFDFYFKKSFFLFSFSLSSRIAFLTLESFEI